MNRLLEGDVGSGKTVVAAAVALNTVASGFQVAFMAPTELLAQQHADTLHGMLPDEYSGTLAFLSGSMSAADKKAPMPR